MLCSTKSILTAAAVAAMAVAAAFRHEIAEIIKQTDINMNDIIIWILWLGLIILGLYGWLLYRHTMLIKDLGNKTAKPDSKLEIEVRGIRTYIEIIAYIAVVFCVGVAIHYLIVCLPRHREIQASNTYYQDMGVDYLGLIVAIFAIIVTILVGWQIYSTIRAKDEVERVKLDAKDLLKTYEKEIENKFSHKIDALEDKLGEVDNNLQQLVSKRNNDVYLAVGRDYFSQGLMYALHSETVAYKGVIYNHGTVYRSFLRAINAYLAGKAQDLYVERCLKNLNMALNHMEKHSHKFTYNIYKECEEIYEVLLTENLSHVNEDIIKEIRRIHKRQIEISFNGDDEID